MTKPEVAKMEGVVERLLLARTDGTIESDAVPEVEATLEGFLGDRHHGFTKRSGGGTPYYPMGTEILNRRQVSAVSPAELETIARDLDVAEVRAEWLGANVSLSGIPRLTLLPPGSRLFFPQGAVLVVTGEALPCLEPGEIIQRNYPRLPNLAVAFPKHALHRRGFVASVERPGRIREGDSVWVLLNEQPSY